jgi:hypothetical protein
VPCGGAGGQVVNREGIERNHSGEEEPHSLSPELWDIDGTELDLRAQYKVGGQLWHHLRSRSVATGVLGWLRFSYVCESWRP